MELFNPEIIPRVTANELRRLEVLTTRRISSDLTGDFRSAFRGTGLTFSELREYVPGDDVKHIHWGATARSGKTYIKTFEEDRSLRIHCALDISRSVSAGGSRSALQQGLEFIALVATLAVQSRDTISVSFFADSIIEFIPSAQSRHHLHTILRALLQPRALPTSTRISHSLYSLSQRLSKRSILFIISDYLSSPFDRELRLLTQKHDVIGVYLDPFSSLPNAGIVRFEDAEQGGSIEIDTSDHTVKEALEIKQKRQLETVRQTLTNAGATFLKMQSSPVLTLHTLSLQRANQWR